MAKGKFKIKLSQYDEMENELSGSNGEGTHDVIIEEVQGENETKERPHYE